MKQEEGNGTTRKGKHTGRKHVKHEKSGRTGRTTKTREGKTKWVK